MLLNTQKIPDRTPIAAIYTKHYIMDRMMLSKVPFAVGNPHPSQEVFIYRALLSDNNRFSLPCWYLQEVGGTLSGFGLWSPEVLYTYKINGTT